MARLSAAQCDKIRMMLGLMNGNEHGESIRNILCCSTKRPPPLIQQMARADLIRPGVTLDAGKIQLWHVTPWGALAAGVFSQVNKGHWNIYAPELQKPGD